MSLTSNLDKHVDMGLVVRKPDVVACKEPMHIQSVLSFQRYSLSVKGHIKSLLLAPFLIKKNESKKLHFHLINIFSVLFYCYI